ncbi:hypothetical protein FA15DRAFT_754133 [Coprinopsis marcescibilis]|uniref:Ser-Thr-rich glycosyl-phosphatidyl-inositol-anchored membrane family-domain-containing protein n=1 Tax=Coprinopsis marcescibilis TaxID=230819 RepID=A0A5C3L402_COPMA|nr:hypothetical protein FA15DRAFT_754133 [Coprinopsis marcescibilis]
MQLQRLLALAVFALSASAQRTNIQVSVPSELIIGQDSIIKWTFGPNDPPTILLMLTEFGTVFNSIQFWDEVNTTAGELRVTLESDIRPKGGYVVDVRNQTNVDMVLAQSPQFELRLPEPPIEPPANNTTVPPPPNPSTPPTTPDVPTPSASAPQISGPSLGSSDAPPRPTEGSDDGAANPSPSQGSGATGLLGLKSTFSTMAVFSVVFGTLL